MIVVDCSAVVDVLLSAPGSGDVRRLLGGRELHAPDLLDVEVVSALRGLVLGRHLSVERASAALGDYDQLPVRRWPISHPFRTRMLSLRDRATAYDAAYVAVAEALGCSLITRDARLARAVDALVDVVLV